MINTMKHYYLINGKVMKGSDMPNIMINHPNYNDIMMTWKKSLQPCEISESELEKIEMYLTKNMSMYMNSSNLIDITDIVSDSNGVITFKHPKQVDEYGYIKCGDCNKFYLCTNCGAQCGSDGHFIEPKQVDGEIEAVEFAEWILCNYNTSEDGMSLCWHNADTRIKKNKYSTKEIYEIFKNRK